MVAKRSPCCIAANVAVGYDNIDVDVCTKRGVVATNTPGVLDETTADFAWTLMMAVARRLSEGEQLSRSGNWKGWNLDQLCGADIWGKTLGLVGFGRIGRAVARRQLHDAEPVAAERQPHGLGVDRDRRRPIVRKVRQIAAVQANGHCGIRLVPRRGLEPPRL